MKSYCACEWTTDGHLRDLCGAHMESLHRAVIREREACAKIAEAAPAAGNYVDDRAFYGEEIAADIARAIRARSA